MEKKSIGTFIAALRKANGLTQRDLAEKLNVSDKAVSRWERDESAPDLSLIPVIADIFGVTSDELLRGQRAGISSAPAREEAKTEKQIRYLLNRSMIRYKTCSLISVTVALLGLIAAMILNFGFLKASVGFFAGCACLLIATLLQLIFLILGKDSIAMDVETDVIKPARQTLTMGAELVFGLIFVSFAIYLPLIVLPVGAFRGLTALSWLEYGSFFGSIATVLWVAGCTILNTRKGYRKRIDWRSPRNQLRLRWVRKGLLLLLAVLVLHLSSAAVLTQNFHLLVRGQKFDNWDDFRRYMELPRDADGTDLTFVSVEGTGDSTRYLYENQDGAMIVFHKDEVSHMIYATAEDEESRNQPLVRYRHLNKQIHSVRLNRGGLPVQVFTQRQIMIVRIITLWIHLLWGLVYFLSLRRLLRRYRQDVKENLR